MSGEAMTKRQIAEQNFLDGYNCTQAVVAAFADELGVDKDTLIKIASSFGEASADCARCAEPSARWA